MKITCTEQQKSILYKIIRTSNGHDCKSLCENYDCSSMNCFSINCKDCIEKNIEWNIVKTLDAKTCISALRFCANNMDCKGCPIEDSNRGISSSALCMLKIANELERQVCQ